MTETNKVSQKDRLGQELRAIKVDVTANDRKEAQEKLKITNATITKYLNGEVFDNDTAVAILLFLRGQIAKRDKQVA